MSNGGFEIRFEAGKSIPVVVCETCGVNITDFVRAGVVWEEYKEGQFSPVTVLCKEFHCLSKPPYQGRPWMELRDFMIWIAFNSGMNTEAKVREAWESSEVMAAI